MRLKLIDIHYYVFNLDLLLLLRIILASLYLILHAFIKLLECFQVVTILMLYMSWSCSAITTVLAIQQKCNSSIQTEDTTVSQFWFAKLVYFNVFFKSVGLEFSNSYYYGYISCVLCFGGCCAVVHAVVQLQRQNLVPRLYYHTKFETPRCKNSWVMPNLVYSHKCHAP